MIVQFYLGLIHATSAGPRGVLRLLQLAGLVEGADLPASPGRCSNFDKNDWCSLRPWQLLLLLFKLAIVFSKLKINYKIRIQGVSGRRRSARLRGASRAKLWLVNHRCHLAVVELHPGSVPQPHAVTTAASLALGEFCLVEKNKAEQQQQPTKQKHQKKNYARSQILLIFEFEWPIPPCSWFYLP